MSLFTIVASQGRGSTDIVESGTNVTLAPGDKVVIDAEHGALSSAVKEDASLLISIRDKITITIDNFFSDPNHALEFSDTTLLVKELEEKLIVHIDVEHADGVERELFVAPFSTIPVKSGDEFEFPNSEVKYNDVHREGLDLQVYFEPGTTAAGKFITLGNFFAHPKGDLQAPIVVLTDNDHHPTDIIVNPDHHGELQWHGVPITSATPGVPYGYYFYLTGKDLSNMKVELDAIEGELPSWLSLISLGEGQYLLSGTPPADFSGELNIEIIAHELRKGVNIHTQQAFQLKAMKSERRATERAMVTAVLAAELRGAPSAQFAGNILTGSEGSLTSLMGAQMSVIAAVSGLTVSNVLAARQLLLTDFRGIDIEGLGITEIETEFKEVKEVLTTTSSDQSTSGLGTLEATGDIILDTETRIDTTDDDDDASSLLSTTLGDPVSPDPPSPSAETLSELSNDKLAGEFTPQPDLFPVQESVDTTVPPDGILANDVDTILDGNFLSVTSINNMPMSIGVPIDLPTHGATITVNFDGSLTYNPNGLFESLPQGALEFDGFTYSAFNGLISNTSSVTITIIGENDAPDIFDGQTFNVLENSVNTTEVGTPLASDVDTGDMWTYTITDGSGAAVFSINLNTGIITVIDMSALDFEQIQSFDIDVQIDDFNFAVPIGFLSLSDSANVTINIIDDNEQPVITNNILEFNVLENTTQNDPAFGQVTFFDDDIINGDNSDSITFTITGGTGESLFEIDQMGNVSVARGADLDFESIKSYTLTVTINDNHLTDPVTLSDTKTFTIHINDENESPSITNKPLEFSVDENSTYDDGVFGQVTVFDDDVVNGSVDFLTYTITGGDGIGIFSIDQMGNVRVAMGQSIDFEMKDSYDIEVTVTDNHMVGPGPLSDVQTFTIVINDVNEAPSITNDPLTFSVTENTTFDDGPFDQVTVFDDDVVNGAVDYLTYTITGGTGEGIFSIDQMGNVRVAMGESIDFEDLSTYTLEVTVNDNHMVGPVAPDAVATFTINILDENEAPSITNDPLELRVDEGTTNLDGAFGQVTTFDDDVNNGAASVDSLTYSITGGNGQNLFEIDNMGNVSVKEGVDLDYEARDKYEIRVTVEDDHQNVGPGPLSVTETFTIFVDDVNEPPSITNDPLTMSVAENTVDTDGAFGQVTVFDDDVNNGSVDSLTYSITGGTGQNIFAIDSNGNVSVASGQSIDYEAFGMNPASYTLEVTVSDNHMVGPVTPDAVATFTINVTDVNEAPSITNDPLSMSVAENTVDTDGAFGQVTVFDDDVNNGSVDSLSYSITGGTGDGIFSIDQMGNVSVAIGQSIDFEAQNTYTLQVTIADNHMVGPVTPDAVATFTINVTDVNEAPSITNDTLTVTIEENTTDADGVIVQVTAFDDDVVNGSVDSLSYSITGGTGDGIFSIDNMGNVSVAMGQTIDYEAFGMNPANYTLEVTVTDDHMVGPGPLSDVQTFTINVLDLNEAPSIANDPLTLSVAENTLNADGSFGQVTVADDDADNGSVDTLHYSITGGEGLGVFVIDNSGNVSVAAGQSIDYETKTSYQLEVTVSDNHTVGPATPDAVATFTVNVTDVNEAPVITNNPLTLSVAENTTDTDGAFGKVVVFDDDVNHGSVDSLTYSITGGSGQSIFAIDSSGNVSVASGQSIDYEAFGMNPANYTLEITVTDDHMVGPGPLSDVQTFTINVLDVYEPAQSPNPALTLSVLENTTNGDGSFGAVDMIDQNMINNYNFSITGGTGQTAFTIDNSGNLSVAASQSIDFEATSSYTIEVTASSTLPMTPDVVETYTINVVDVNEAPSITNDPMTFSVAENTVDTDGPFDQVTVFDDDVVNGSVDSLSYTITGGDGMGLFAIDNSGNVSVAAGQSIDYETKTSYQLEVTVNDNHTVGPATANAVETFTINITDVNEAPIITNDPLTFTIVENITDADGTFGKVVAFDDDVNNGSVDSLSYTITGGDGLGVFTIDSAGNLSVASGQSIDYEAKTSYQLEVTVSDNHMVGPMTSDALATFTINVIDLNEAPSITNDPLTFSVVENTVDTDGAFGQVTAFDDDVVNGSVDCLSYTITGGDGLGVFAIDSNGNVSVATGQSIDFEAKSSYQLEVTVSDNHAVGPLNAAAVETFTINVTDVNEAPLITNDPAEFSVDENVDGGTFVGQVTVFDDDVINGTDDSLSFRITGGDGRQEFSIDDDGKVTVRNNANLDYEDTNTYEIVVEVRDDHQSASPTPLTHEVTFTISINDLPEQNIMAYGGQSSSEYLGPTLTTTTLSLVAATAVQHWAAAGITQEQHAMLDNIEYSIVDLSDGVLATQFSDQIHVDINAADYGWYVDGAPIDIASSNMDLLTVLMHEMGHALGAKDLEYDSDTPQLMAGELESGTRILVEDSLNFENLGDADHHEHEHLELDGAELFSDVDHINVDAIPETFADEAASVNDQTHITANITVESGWFQYGVDKSHVQYEAASGSIVDPSNESVVI